MNFEKILISGEFIKRYKRFLVDVKINNKIVTAHCPNTGSMLGLLKKGNKVWLSKSDNPKRKLKYTLQIIEDKKSKVGINTHLANKIVLNALNDKLIPKEDPFPRSFLNFGKSSFVDIIKIYLIPADKKTESG